MSLYHHQVSSGHAVQFSQASAPPPSYGSMRVAPYSQASFAGRATNDMSTKLLLRLACRDVIKLDRMSQSDPMVVVYMNSSRTQHQWREIGRTERIKNAKNPNFEKVFEVTYHFEELQRMRFAVYDADGRSTVLDNHDFVGQLDCTIGEIVGSAHGKLIGELQNDKKSTNNSKSRGMIHIMSEEVQHAAGMVHMQFRASKLDKKDFGLFAKSDPFIEFTSVMPNGQHATFHKTEVIRRTLNPTWRAVHLSTTKMCNGDFDRELKLNCYDWDSDGSHDLIGSCVTSLGEIAAGKREWDLVNPKKMPGGKKAKRGYKNSGVLHLLSYEYEERASFLDYILGGMELMFTIAIDFTGSNGNPALPTSLHYVNPYQPNEYEQAIRAVGSIIQDYDTDKLFPAMGYGGKSVNGVSHNFALNGNEGNPYCCGIDGVVSAYKTALQYWQLFGPTNFAPVIQSVSSYAAESARTKPGQQYFVLLIITDGVITDMANTVSAIVAASHLPMSIIIVGVGQANFDAMDALDGDDGHLVDHRRQKAVRDIVQFVPFRKYQANAEALAAEVLAELPDQVLEYMRMNKIKPTKGQ
eukprot:m.327581 g.327581  ORF g.327581 m.327581 type:complete len:580 (+) comp20415_c0_seq2:185-1924(+)